MSDPAAPCRTGNWMKKFDVGSAMRVVGLARMADGGKFAGLVELAAAGPGTPSRAHLETPGAAASHPAHFSLARARSGFDHEQHSRHQRGGPTRPVRPYPD